MQTKQPQEPKIQEPEYDGPSGEELTAGALLEMLKKEGMQPFDLVSSRPGKSSHAPEIPKWFLNASDSI